MQHPKLRVCNPCDHLMSSSMCLILCDELIIMPCRLKVTRMFCLECARYIPRDEHGKEGTPPRPSRRKSKPTKLTPKLYKRTRCNCAFACTALVKYALKLLSMCAPESLRPLAAYNNAAITNEYFHSVILPNLHEVEHILRNRNTAE